MKLPVPSRRANIVLAWVLALALIVFGAWLIGKVVTLGEENHHLEEQDRQSRADRAKLFDEVESDKVAIEALREQLKQLGEKPVVEPDDVPDGSRIVVVPGPRGLSCIEDAGLTACRGPSGEPGKPGADGSDGVDGTDGQDGADSTVPGPKGEPGKDGRDGVDGAPGKDGEPGRDGQDGRGIQSVTCEGGVFVVTYTDGTSQPVAGSSCTFAPGNSGGTQ